MKVPRYPKTALSGIQWLGALPHHWEAIPLKYVTRFVNGMAFKPDEWSHDGVPIIRIENLNGGDEFNGFDGEVLERYHVRKGDLLFGWSGNRGTSFGPFEWPREGLHYLNQHIFRLAEYKCDKRWFYWTLKALTKTIEDEAHGIIGMVHITKGELGALKIPRIPVPEQKQIAAFLDWKTAQVDALIARKKELLEKLKEERLAVITQAVTRGLNSSAPLRDSGIPWLGRVPQHWQVMKFGYRTNIQEGQVDPQEDPYSALPLIAPNHVESGTGRVFDVTSAHDQAAISGKYLVRKGDVVYSKIRPHLNKCALVDFDGLCSADMYPIRTEHELTSGFLLYWILAQPFVDYATESSMRVAMPKLNRDTLSAAPLVVPPESEQKAIVGHILKVTNRIGLMAAKVEAAIDRLAEYRTALITDATTGKIDVRKVKIPQPVA